VINIAASIFGMLWVHDALQHSSNNIMSMGQAGKIIPPRRLASGGASESAWLGPATKHVNRHTSSHIY